MYKPFHLVPANTRIDFMRFHKPAFAFSVILVVASVVLMFTKGLNFGIDFAGGVLMEVQSEQSVDLAQMRSQLDALNVGEVTLQTFGAPNDVLIQGSLPSVRLALDTPDFALQAANNALALKPEYAPAR